MHVADGGGESGQMEQDGGRDVVGQVAHHAQVFTQATEIETQHVALVHGEPHRIELRAQAGGEIAVDLHHVQMPQVLQQGPRQRAQARADLHHAIPGLRGDGRDDAGEHTGVVQEMLTELLLVTIVRAHPGIVLDSSAEHARRHGFTQWMAVIEGNRFIILTAL